MAERKHQYDPLERLTEVRGVRLDQQLRQDVYKGTKEQLVAMGLAPADLFPGEPGMPLTSVMLWPRGTARRSGYVIPGRLSLSRNPSGLFTAMLVVSETEQERRAAARKVQAEQEERALRMKREQHRGEMESANPFGKTDWDRVFDLLVHEIGIQELARRIRRLQQGQRPASAVAHLQLVWNARPSSPARQ